MILHEFPDIAWLKSQINQGFTNRQGWKGLALNTTGFPSVIIHTTVRECYRPDIKGPLSLFLNLRGTSYCQVEGETRRVEEGYYCISNCSQRYTLQIERGEPVETFNIHFGETFGEEVLSALLTRTDQVLDNGQEYSPIPFGFFNGLQRRDAVMDRLIGQITHAYQEHGFDPLLFEQQLTGLLTHLLQQHRQVLTTIHRLPPVRSSTRTELYRRLSRALDYIHSTPLGTCSLDDLAAAACLSKYHFLRLFRLTYGVSPHRYIQQQRLERAQQLLARTPISISDLSDTLGFANSQSFSRLFTQQMGISPSRYRERSAK